MTGTHSPALFALAVLVVNATPGVDLMFTLTRTLQQGVRGGLAAAAGVASGCVLHALAAAFGLAALLAASAAAFTALKMLGAAYLAWLAIGLWRSAARPGSSAGRVVAAPEPTATAPRADLALTYRQALFSNALNPKVAIFFLALLPQFIDAASPHKTAGFLFLGAWFVVQGFVFLALFAASVSPLRRWQPSGAWRRALQAGAGLTMAGLAARLALADRP